MDQNNDAKYVILTQDILTDDRINSTEKLILARITGFKVFFEASSETAKFMHVSELAVQRAKRKLERLGYISVVENTGRGKKYQAELWKSQVRPNKKVTSDLTKKSGLIEQKSHIENKKRIKEEESSKNEYGRADINDLAELWKKEIGVDIKGQQGQRRQLYNLVRKYGKDKTVQIIELAGEAAKSGDRFAPMVTLPSDLTGQYEKLSKLDMWKTRKNLSRPFGNNRPTPAPAIATAPLKQKLPDYGGAFDEQSDTEREKVSKMMREARQKLAKKVQ